MEKLNITIDMGKIDESYFQNITGMEDSMLKESRDLVALVQLLFYFLLGLEARHLYL